METGKRQTTPKEDPVPETRDETTENERFCTKPFDAENARVQDTDEPCDNGED